MKLFNTSGSVTPSNEDIATYDSGRAVEGTGCAEANDNLLLCFDRERDWRRCKAEIEAFSECFREYQRSREERIVKRIEGMISEAVDKIESATAELEAELSDKDVDDHISSIPYSTEQ